ncbi:hypothetical protein FRC01_011203, partial [Tulasnella sp. 417]
MDARKTSQTGPRRRWSLHIVDLPYDIIVAIFIQCSKYQKKGDGPHFPTTASHVCRTWRQHALATPIFWTTLEFYQLVPALEKYRTWLERSGEAPLDITIGSEPFKQASIKNAREIMRLTVPHIRQWRSLTVHGLPDKILRLIFDRMGEGGTDKLERLEMIKFVKDTYERWFRTSIGQTKWTFKGFRKGEMPPNLRHIILEGDSSQFFKARFKGLQVLEILNRFIYTAAYEVYTIHELLSSFPDLRVLRVDDGRYLRLPIEVDSTQGVPNSPVPVFTQQTLTELSLQGPQVTRNTVILSLILPNLRYILDRRGREPVLGLACLSHFAHNHPFPKLISLRLGGSHSSRPPYPSELNPPDGNATNMIHLEGALAGLPELKALTFDHVNFEGGGGKQTYLSCVGRVCPRLRWLILVRCVGYTLEDLVSIAGRRKRASELASLALITVQDWEFPEGTEEDMEALEPLVGLDFIDLHDYTYADADDLVEREWLNSRRRIVGILAALGLKSRTAPEPPPPAPNLSDFSDDSVAIPTAQLEGVQGVLIDTPRRPHVGLPSSFSNNVPDLPYDILFMIFILCWKEQDELDEAGGFGAGGSHFPTLASHVCQAWRQCALSTPAFWAALEFRQRVPPIEKYQTWLERSGDGPLDITIGPQPFRQSSIKHAKEILWLTEPHFRRWRSMRVYGLPEKVLRLIFDRISLGGMERLENLETVKVVQEEWAREKFYPER